MRWERFGEEEEGEEKEERVQAFKEKSGRLNAPNAGLAGGKPRLK